MKRRIVENITTFMEQENVEDTRIYSKLRKLDELLCIDNFVSSLSNDKNSEIYAEINDVSVLFIKPEVKSKDMPIMKFHLTFKYGDFDFNCLQSMWFSMDSKPPNRIIVSDEWFGDICGIHICENDGGYVDPETIPTINEILHFIHKMSVQYCGYDVFEVRFFTSEVSSYRKISPGFTIPLLP